jgi:orotidine-5'-phosphate decarboxylase
METIMTWTAKIQQIILETNSLLCVGLDPDPGKIPAHLLAKADPVYQFCKAIIDSTVDFAAAYKPNLAFFEALGSEGMDILRRIVSHIPEGRLKIGDAKRGDIGSTAERYAHALADLGFDSFTVNPFLGEDSVRPFLKDPSRGAFVLCLTSNPGSRDFQQLSIDKEPLYLHVARAVNRWNDQGNCGLVVGATHPQELSTVRETALRLPFLIPGIGAQGGDLEATIAAGTNEFGGLAFINASRSILYASGGEDFAEAARLEAERLNKEINRFRKRKTDRIASEKRINL